MSGDRLRSFADLKTLEIQSNDLHLCIAVWSWRCKKVVPYLRRLITMKVPRSPNESDQVNDFWIYVDMRPSRGRS